MADEQFSEQDIQDLQAIQYHLAQQGDPRADKISALISANTPTTGAGIAARAKASLKTAQAIQPESLFKPDYPSAEDVAANTWGGLQEEAQGLGDVASGLYGMARHPIDTVTGEAKRIYGEGAQAYQAAKQGQYGSAVGHALAMNPLEPMIEQPLQTVASGQPLRALGQVAGTVVAGKAIGEGAKRAAPILKDALERAAVKTANPGLYGLTYGEESVPPPGSPMAAWINNSQLKVPNKGFAFGRDPGNEVANRGITGNSIENWRDNIQKERVRTGRDIQTAVEGSDRAAAQSGSANIPDDIRGAISAPFDDLIAKASRAGDDALASRLSKVKDAYMGKKLEHFGIETADMDAAGNPNELAGKPTRKQLWDLSKEISNETTFKDDTYEGQNLNAVKAQVYSNLRTILENNTAGVEPLSQSYGNLLEAEKAADLRAFQKQRQGPFKAGWKAATLRHPAFQSRLAAILAPEGTAEPHLPYQTEIPGLSLRPDLASPINVEGGFPGMFAEPSTPSRFPLRPPVQVPDMLQSATRPRTSAPVRPPMRNLLYPEKPMEGPPALIEGSPRQNFLFSPEDIQSLREEGAQQYPNVIDLRPVPPRAGEIEYRTATRSRIIHPDIPGELSPDVPPSTLFGRRR